MNWSAASTSCRTTGSATLALARGGAGTVDVEVGGVLGGEDEVVVGAGWQGGGEGARVVEVGVVVEAARRLLAEADIPPPVAIPGELSGVRQQAEGTCAVERADRHGVPIRVERWRGAVGPRQRVVIAVGDERD